MRPAREQGIGAERDKVESSRLAQRHQVRRVPVFAWSVVRAAGKPDLHGRDPSQTGAPSGAARTDPSTRTLGESAAAAQRECGAKPRKLKQIDYKSPCGKAL